MTKDSLDTLQNKLSIALQNQDIEKIEKCCKQFFQEEKRKDLLHKNIPTDGLGTKFLELNKALSKTNTSKNQETSESFLNKLLELGRLILEAIKQRLLGISKPLLPMVVATSFIASPINESLAMDNTPNPNASPTLHIPKVPEGEKDTLGWGQMIRTQYVEKQLDKIGFTDQEVRKFWELVGKEGMDKEKNMMEAFESILKVKKDQPSQPSKPSQPTQSAQKPLSPLDPNPRGSVGSVGSVGLIAVNHFKMDVVENDLPKFKKMGIETLAVELPEDLQDELIEYLESPRTNQDMLKFGQSWIDASPTKNLESLEGARKALETITGEKVTLEDIQQKNSPENPMDGNTTLKYLVNTTAKAHDLGFKVVAIDEALNAETNSPNSADYSPWQKDNKSMETRNNTMASNLASLSKTSKTLAVIGGAHTDHAHWSTTVQSCLKDLKISTSILSYERGTPTDTEITIKELFKKENKKNESLEDNSIQM